MLTIEEEGRPDGTVVCRAIGELDAFTVHDFRDALRQRTDVERLVIDLSGVPFVDSAGLGALIGAVRRIHEHAGKVVVVCDRPVLVRLLYATGIDRVVAIVDTEAEAEQALGEDHLTYYGAS